MAQVSPSQAPNAGQLERQLREAERLQEERERSRKSLEPALRVPPPVAAEFGAGSVVVKLTALVWGPSQFLTGAELQSLANPLLGKQVTFEQIQQWVEQVNALYRSKGQFAARAILPPQTVQGGTIRIELIEAKADAVKLTGTSQVRESWVRRWIPVVVGETVDTLALERGLQKWNASSDARLSADMTPGKSVAGTEIVAQLQEPTRFGGSVGLANDGNDTTGRLQATASLRWFSPTGLGDKASLGLTKSQGVKALTLQYAVPLHHSGTRLFVSTARSDFTIVSGPFAVLGVNGNSASTQLGLNQPVWASGPWQVELSGVLNQQRSETFTGGASPGSILLKSSSLGASFTRRTESADIAGSYTAQKAQLGPATAPAQDYLIFNGALSALWSFGTGQSLALRTAWQKSPSDVLPATLQYSIGGPSLVRGYGASVAFGEQGYSGTLEYSKSLSSNLSGSVFYDRGSVWGATKSRVSIDSVGAGFEWRGSGTFDRLTASGHIGYVLIPSLAGSTGRTRTLVRLSYAF